MLRTELDLKTLNEVFFSFYDENATILYSPIPQAIEKIVFIWDAYVEYITEKTYACGDEEIVTIIAECKTENNENIIIQLDMPMSPSKVVKILGIKSYIIDE